MIIFLEHLVKLSRSIMSGSFIWAWRRVCGDIRNGAILSMKHHQVFKFLLGSILAYQSKLTLYSVINEAWRYISTIRLLCFQLGPDMERLGQCSEWPLLCISKFHRSNKYSISCSQFSAYGIIRTLVYILFVEYLTVALYRCIVHYTCAMHYNQVQW